MSRCVSEETLLSLYEGEGSQDERTHLIKCQICTIRYERLAKDLKLLGQVLRDPPPRPVIVRAQQVLVPRWLPVVTASAAVGLLLWSQMQGLEIPNWLPPKPPPLAPTAASEVRDEDLARFLAKAIGPAVFATTDLGVKDLPKRATTLAYLQAALDGGWPSERCERDRTQGCDSDPFALLLDPEGS